MESIKTHENIRQQFLSPFKNVRPDTAFTGQHVVSYVQRGGGTIIVEGFGNRTGTRKQ